MVWRKQHPLDAHVRYERWINASFDRWYHGQGLLRWHRVLGVFLMLIGLTGWAKEWGWVTPVGAPSFDCLVTLGLNPRFCR